METRVELLRRALVPVFPHPEGRGLMKGSGSQVARGAARCMEHSPAQVRDLLQGCGAFVSPVGMFILV